MGVVILCVFVVLCVQCCFFTLDAGLLARSQYSEGPLTGIVAAFAATIPVTSNNDMKPKSTL